MLSNKEIHEILNLNGIKKGNGNKTEFDKAADIIYPVSGILTEYDNYRVYCLLQNYIFGSGVYNAKQKI